MYGNVPIAVPRRKSVKWAVPQGRLDGLLTCLYGKPGISAHGLSACGRGRVTRGAETLTLKENESVSIPLGEAHRLENPGKTPLRLIEVQSGSYLGEDDIVRLDDIYGRT